jgi:eukaryotic-like serine/threonine-protein kinase
LPRARIAGTLPRVREMDLLDGRYRLRELLHAAGSRQWWYADDEALARDVEVTVSDETFLDDTFAHPHLLRVYAVGELASASDHKLRYVVSEPVTGVSLRSRLAKGPLPWPAAVRTGAEVAGVLAAVHGRGLVFGDLRAADVFLTPAGAKVTRLSVLTESSEHRPATDVYALGRLLYLMITGGAGDTRSIRSLPAVDGMPLSVVDLCAQCLSPDPDERPMSHKVARALATAGIAPGEDTTGEELSRGTAVDVVRYRQPSSPLWNVPTAVAPPADHAGVGDDAGGTVLLPRALPPQVAPDGSGQRRRSRPMLVPVAAAAAVAGAVVTSILLLGGARAGMSSAAVPAAGIQAQAGIDCQVRYQIRSDVRGKFVVDVTLTNLGTRALRDWTLVFAFPGDQKVVRGRAARWQQVGNEVSVREPDPATPLDPSGATIVGFDGTYRSANPWPTAFAVNGTDCAYVVLDNTGQVRSTGTPGRQVPTAGTSTSPGAIAPGGSGSEPSPSFTTTPTRSPTSKPSAAPNDGNGGHSKPSDKASHH